MTHPAVREEIAAGESKANTISITLGLLAPPLTEQLKGFGIEEEKTKAFDKMANAINDLYISDLLTGAQALSIRKRLFSQIEKAAGVKKPRRKAER